MGIAYLIPRHILVPLEKGTKYLSNLWFRTASSPADSEEEEVESQRVGSNLWGEGKISGE